MFGVTVLGFALNILSSYQYVRVSASVLFDMRLALYQHLQTLSPRFWASRKLGDVVSRINNDIAEVQRVSADSLLSVLSNVVFLIGSAAIMVALSPRLFLVSVAAVPASIWALQHYQHRLAARVRAVRERSSDIGSFLLETLLGIRLVVSAQAESREVERFRARNQSFLDALDAHAADLVSVRRRSRNHPDPFHRGVFLYGGKLVIDGSLTTGSLVALMAYHLRLLSPVQNLMSLYSNLVSGGVSLSRVLELFDTPTEIVDRPGLQPLRTGSRRNRVRSRFVRLWRRRRAGRPVIPRSARHHLRDPGPQRRRQVDAGGSARAVLRSRMRARFASTAGICAIFRWLTSAMPSCCWIRRRTCLTPASARISPTRGQTPATMKS